MSHSPWLTLIVPDSAAQLARATESQTSRWPQLARLAGRGSVRHEWDRRDGDAVLRPWQRGLLAALKLPAAQFPSAPVSFAGGSGEEGGYWLQAEPVHFAAGLDRLTFLGLRNEARVTDAERIALEPVLADHLRSADWSLRPLAGEWFIQSPRALAVQTSCLEAAASNELESVMPRGPDAGELRRLMTELQMLLHEHPVNEARTRRGLPAINAVWPWGSGVAASARSVDTLALAFGDESYLRGIYQLHGQPVQPLPQGGGALLPGLAQAQRSIAVVKVADIDSLEQQWIAPLMRALAAREIERLDLVLDGLHCDISRPALRRFWRRPLPPSQWPMDASALTEKSS